MAADDFVDMVTRFRTLWLGGRYGGGKTALAVHLAARICQAGYADKIVSNTPLNLPLVARIEERDVHDVTYAVLLLDEAWRWLGRRFNSKVNDWLAYLRKRDQVLLLPSVLPLCQELRVLQARRTLNLYTIGVPLWVYTYMLDDGSGIHKQKRGGLRQQGVYSRWWWWRPDKVFALYDHSLLEMADFGVYRWPSKAEFQIAQTARKLPKSR